MRSTPTASVTVDVDAPAERVYAWVTDLDTLAGFAEEAQAMTWVSGTSAQVGSVFVGRNRNGWRRWSTRCTVTDAELGRRFGFTVASGPVPVARWEYTIAPTGPTSCQVTERTWDQRPRWFKRPAALVTGVADRDTASRDHIAATLARIQERAERS